VDVPETRYARTDDGVHIAYQVIGDGPADLVFVAGFVTNVEYLWEGWPQSARGTRRLASSTRLILFDRRGTGLSDHIVPDESGMTLEARMDDIRAVMDAAGLERAILLGFEGGVAPCALFAATYPERTSALIAFAPEYGRWTPDTPWRGTDEEWEEYLAGVDREWGSLAFAERAGRYVWPDIGDDPDWWRTYARWMRRAVSPGDAVAILRIDSDTDVGDILTTIHVPVLVICHRDEYESSRTESRFMAERVPGARLLELPGTSHAMFAPEQDAAYDEIEAFVRELTEEAAALDRTLATVLFTDIVGSTEKAAQLGDHQWRALLEQHHVVVRSMLARYRGTEIDTAGDGFLATFEGPARAVRCAEAIMASLTPLGIRVRAGVHTGEVESVGGKVGGIAVAIGARVTALAAESEILVSSTVKDLTAGSGLLFEEAGEHELKGVPDRWHLYRVVDQGL
jgi:class 3 adenylate cyclase